MKKRIGYTILLAVLVVTLGFGFSPASSVLAATHAVPLAEGDAGAAYMPGQLIVGLAPSTSLGSFASRADAVAQAVGAKLLKSDDQGTILLDVGKYRSLEALALTLKRIKGVRYAEPNNIYRDAPLSETAPSPAAGPSAGPVGTQKLSSSGTGATYPNDPFLSFTPGWKYIGADIVWSNTTASKTVCVLDSGVDYTHKDLAANVIKGLDYVNNDSDPMDDNGRGTHVAGIIAAIRNNKEGIAGVSTGKVLAVKVLDASGIGTAFDIGLGLRYCADHADIVDVSWTGAWSQTLQDAVSYAVATKSKLVVAAAGDSLTNSPDNFYPAAFSQNLPAYQAFNYGVLAVAASGSDSSSCIGHYYDCRYIYSNYGNWIAFVAPGYHIFSTTPWDKSFYLNDSGGVNPRYDYMRGTPMAAAFVAAAAARAWGYQPTLSNIAVVNRLKTTGFAVNTTGGVYWDSSMTNAREVNVASAMDRGAITLRVRDAITSTVLEGATVTVYNKTTNALVGSAVVTPISTIDPVTGLVVLHFVDAVDIINLSTVGSPVYMPKVSASNYTASPQQAFVGYLLNPDGSFTPTPGKILDDGLAEVPPKSANFTLVGGNMNDASSIISRFGIWLPSDNKYIVSINHGNANYGDPTIAPYGSLNEHPFARWMMQYFLETIVIRNRPTDTAAPYYPGDYLVGLTDNATKGPNDLDTGNVSVMVWKDGVIKKRVDKGTTLCGPLAHWWFPLQISSGASGAATYDKPYSMVCGAWLNSPYQ